MTNTKMQHLIFTEARNRSLKLCPVRTDTNLAVFRSAMCSCPLYTVTLAVSEWSLQNLSCSIGNQILYELVAFPGLCETTAVVIKVA